jgi:hypothetical protein
LGFNLRDLAGQPLQIISAGQPALIQLYWEWQGKAPDEPIGLSLIDDNGQVWGWGRPLDTQARFPFEQWQDGMIAHDDFILEVFPGTPPGDYYLKAWIDRPATGELVGVFPLPLADVHIPVSRPGAPLASTDLSLAVRLDAPLAAGQISLLGLDHDRAMATPWQPGESRTLTLFWQANGTIAENYPLRLALLDSKGLIRAEWTGLPAAGRFPTDRWQAGDIVRDPWQLSLPAYVPPGDYRLAAQLGELPAVELLAAPVGGRPRLFEPPPLDMPLKARFGDNIELLGLRRTSAAGQSVIDITPGQPLAVDLIWQATALIEADYTLTVQLLDSQEQVRAQHDGMPLAGAAPTGSWAAGEIVPETVRLDIPVEVGPGPHHLLLAFYRFETGQRLLLPDGSDHLTIPVILTDQ